VSLNLLPRPRRADFGLQTVPATPLRPAREPSLPPQGYRLRIGSEGVAIDAADAAGEFYARSTLAQLARLHGGSLPVGTVEDWPDLAARGVMLDISRDKVPTLATLKELVDRLASWKLNQLQLYIEHTFAYTAHADVWRDASPLTAAEVRDLDAYCRERHVELVPNQNCLGHWERWLRHDRYRDLALRPGGWEHHGRRREATTIDPANPAALDLVRELLGELLPNFSSGRVHVGLDEPWELPKDRLDDYLRWVTQLRDLPELDGREMLMWGDILNADAGALARLPGDVGVCEWWYDAGWPWEARGAAYQRADRAWWACPGTSSWQTILGRWDNAVADISESADGARAHGAAGIVVTDWGDRGHLQYLPVSEPAIAWTAAQSWCREANADLDLAAALDAYCYDDRAGVLGDTLRRLGNAYQEIGPQFPNLSTLVLHLYFPQASVGRTFTEGITAQQVDAAEGVLADGGNRLASARPGRPDGALVIDELRSAVDLVRLLCRDLRARLEAAGTLESVPERVRVRLADELAPLVAHHRDLWLARNRPGGLDDSTSWLEHLERCYRTGVTDPAWGGW
jgi:hexosaminidase